MDLGLFPGIFATLPNFTRKMLQLKMRVTSAMKPVSGRELLRGLSSFLGHTSNLKDCFSINENFFLMTAPNFPTKCYAGNKTFGQW
jgi:hypothetical protein